MIGSAAEIADTLEEWFNTGAADGFNICPAILPSGLDDFIDCSLFEGADGAPHARIGIAPEGHGSEADLRHEKAGATELLIFHGVP